MNPSFRRLPSLLDTYAVGIRDRAYVLALGIARSLAYKLPVPTTPVEVPMVYFSLTCHGGVAGALSEVNEQVVINIDLAMRLTKQLWLLRYNVVHDMSCETVRRFIDESVEVGTQEVPPNASELFRQYNNQGLFEEISRLVQCDPCLESNAA